MVEKCEQYPEVLIRTASWPLLRTVTILCTWPFNFTRPKEMYPGVTEIDANDGIEMSVAMATKNIFIWSPLDAKNLIVKRLQSNH